MAESRREVALALAGDILADIELSRIPAPEVVRKTSRLARLLDDADAVAWLHYEIGGYANALDSAAAQAATRSHRQSPPTDSGQEKFWTSSLSRLQANVDGGMAQIRAAVDASVSITSANPTQHVFVPSGNGTERGRVRNHVAEQQDLIGKIIGAMHAYVSERELELRFGAAAENAFSIVRNAVDARIADLAPGAAGKLAAAFENASSGNPEHWANAASACRRLIKAIADELRPSGPPVNGRDMTDDKYINRLVDWIVSQGAIGGTLKEVITSDLEHFGKRIDALDNAGHKGAHAEVTQYEASRFITGAYLLIGDILTTMELAAETDAEKPDSTIRTL